MLVHVPNVLTPDEVARCRAILEANEWVDGRETAGEQAAKAKFNLQIPEGSPAGMQAGDIILRALGRDPTFNSAALPLRVLPPLFNRYDVGMTFHAHVDGAIRAMPHNGLRLRADVSSTLFLTPPEDYDGGELVIEDTLEARAFRLSAGDAILYPSTTLHRVAPVTRGVRLAVVGWVESWLRDPRQREILFDLDRAVAEIHARDGHSALFDTLAKTRSNLLRIWAGL